MSGQTIVNALAVAGIVALGIAAKFGPAGNGDQIALAAVSSLAGFIGGVGAAHLAGRGSEPGVAARPEIQPA
jgi:hypothetical protein